MQNKGKDFQEVSQYNCEVPKEVSKTEAIIYDWVATHFGETEACDPSWNIHSLAECIDKYKDKEYKQQYTVAYDES